MQIDDNSKSFQIVRRSDLMIPQTSYIRALKLVIDFYSCLQDETNSDYGIAEALKDNLFRPERYNADVALATFEVLMSSDVPSVRSMGLFVMKPGYFFYQSNDQSDKESILKRYGSCLERVGNKYETFRDDEKAYWIANKMDLLERNTFNNVLINNETEAQSITEIEELIARADKINDISARAYAYIYILRCSQSIFVQIERVCGLSEAKVFFREFWDKYSAFINSLENNQFQVAFMLIGNVASLVKACLNRGKIDWRIKKQDWTDVNSFLIEFPNYNEMAGTWKQKLEIPITEWNKFRIYYISDKILSI